MDEHRARTTGEHRRVASTAYLLLFGLIVVTLVGSLNNLIHSFGDEHRFYNASLIVVVCVILLLLWEFARGYALAAQDRAIRAEENLRHFVLSGRLLDPRLTTRQIMGLRFAADEEFVALAKQAADQGMSPDAITKSITRWRPDTQRADDEGTSHP